jgi:hypothetical protein
MDTKFRDKKFRNKNYFRISWKYNIFSRNFASDLRKFREIKEKFISKFR